LLALCPPQATVTQHAVFAHGATIISGTRIVDEAAVLHTVGQDASFSQVSGVKLLTFTHESGNILQVE
jgi:hypothetical protein